MKVSKKIIIGESILVVWDKIVGRGCLTKCIGPQQDINSIRPTTYGK